ncbi:hypothetical protein [Lacisediminimonas sp.]|uniref:hypothetical protein n=1 Tax=Lacisediminimonas sp. TaxID=3060582 RepID=UPI00271CACFB|nr:hypothetical protein [Lacisediminimonas sp.]MDO8298341.1 hypothetical protein [Lacisediminimonas sp.]
MDGIVLVGLAQSAKPRGLAGFVLLSGLLHASVIFWVSGAMSSMPEAETPRLSPVSVSVRLLPAAGSAATINPAPGAQASGPTVSNQPTSQDTARDPKQAGQPDNWLPSGRLTRLPVPLDPVDLDQPDLQSAGFTGRIELTVLVDRHGRVERVLSASREPAAQAFAERAAGRFRSVRFAPGEVDGVAVNAILKISVVSERVGGS